MPDTVRTLAALQALHADNAAGDISAQDNRDLLVSVFPPQFSGAKLVKDSTQGPIASDTLTEITWETAAIDTDSYADLANDQLTIPADFGGYYLVVAAYAATGGGTSSLIIINVNAAAFASATTGTSNFSPNLGITSPPLLLAAGDDITLDAYHDVGKTISAGNETFLAIIRLGQAPA